MHIGFLKNRVKMHGDDNIKFITSKLGSSWLTTLRSYLCIVPTHVQILQYYYFTPIRISAFRMPSSGGHSVKIIDYTSIV
jgi:hypothetical protein